MFSQKMTLGIMASFKGGGGGSAGGGSAGAGTVDYPQNMKHVYYSMLNNWGSRVGLDAGELSGDEHEDQVYLPEGKSMIHAIDEAWDNNPYQSLVAFDPTDWLEETQTRLNSYAERVDALNTISDFGDFVEEAVAQGEVIIDDSTISAAADAFEQRQRAIRARAISRNNAGFADINAIMGSAFIIANAMIENDFAAEVAKFNADVTMQFARDRNVMVAGLVAELIKMDHFNVESARALAALQGEANRVRIVAMREYVDDEAELSLKYDTWRITLFSDGANLLGAIHGSAVSSKTAERKSSTGVSALGGAISGGATAAIAASTMGAGLLPMLAIGAGGAYLGSQG